MIREQIEEVLHEPSKNSYDRDSRQRHADFYDEMKRSGMVIKREYDLPPLDSIEKGPALARIYFQQKQK